MFETIHKLIVIKHLLSHTNAGVTICQSGFDQGIDLAKDILLKVCDKQSILYLSGGKTPRDLYYTLAREDTLIPGAVALVDERFGKKFHSESNEKMIQESGLLRYLELRGIPFHPILTGNTSRKHTAMEYDQQLRSFVAIYPKNIGILGIGLDGHTAGIAGNRTEFHNPMFDGDRKLMYVSEFNDEKGMFKERVSMTFLGLSMLDLLIVLVFGVDKMDALEKVFQDGSEEDIPARFFKRPDIAEKTILITDQQI